MDVLHYEQLISYCQTRLPLTFRRVFVLKFLRVAAHTTADTKVSMS